jgi:hypothetical protein
MLGIIIFSGNLALRCTNTGREVERKLYASWAASLFLALSSSHLLPPSSLLLLALQTRM